MVKRSGGEVSKVRLVLEADSIELFDSIKRMKTEDAFFYGLGQQVAGALMTGDPSFWEKVGLLAAYGIEVVSAEKVKDA